MNTAQDQVRTEEEFMHAAWNEHCAEYLRELRAAFQELCPLRDFGPANKGEC